MSDFHVDIWCWGLSSGYLKTPEAFILSSHLYHVILALHDNDKGDWVSTRFKPPLARKKSLGAPFMRTENLTAEMQNLIH